MAERYARITGWGKYAPKRVLTNTELEQMVDTSDEWITTRTGIKERRIAGPDEPTSVISVKAGEAALEVAGLHPRDLDLIIVATSSPDYFLPPVSSQVQDMLGAACGAFTLVAGCTGFVYAMTVAQQFIENGAYDAILVIGAEEISFAIDYTDRTTCVLFGDAAGAVVMQTSSTPTGVLSFELGSDGSGAEHLIVPGGGSANPFSAKVLENREHYIRMNGREVFKFATRTLGKSLLKVLNEADLTPDEIDLFIPHQANTRIVTAAARLMKVPEEKFYMNIQRYGNTSAASIPVALVEALEEGRCQPGDTVALVGFGAGLTWASAVVHIGGPTDETMSQATAGGFFLWDQARRMYRRASGAVQGFAADMAVAVGERLGRF